MWKFLGCHVFYQISFSLFTLQAPENPNCLDQPLTVIPSPDALCNLNFQSNLGWRNIWEVEGMWKEVSLALEWAVSRVWPVQILWCDWGAALFSCMLSESSEWNSNHIVHFWCVSSITTTVGKKLLHYCLQQHFRTAGRNGKCGYVCRLSQLTFHFISHCKGLSSSCAHMSGILLHSGLPWDSTSVLQIHQAFFENISHQVSLLFPCSRHCGKAKVQVNGLLPKSKVLCSWVYQNTNVATRSKWRNCMPYMEVYVEGLLNWDPAKGTEVICLFLLSSFDSPSALGLFFCLHVHPMEHMSLSWFPVTGR